MRIGLVVLAVVKSAALADDWPTYMHDNARSGVTAERVELPLTPQWTHRAPAAPQPAWPDPQANYNELPKVKYDDALYTVAVGSNVYFGSSVDNRIYALEAETGRLRWSFFTGGPVRLAPAIDRNRLYAGSDDGNVYCLSAEEGRLLWQHAPYGPRRVIGNGRISSLWPVRTGVLINGDRAYFGSGIFPYHTPSNSAPILAVNAETGRLIPWKGNTNKGWRDLSPQGYLMGCESGLVVNSGRAMPVVLDWTSGNRLYTLMSRGRQYGGVYGVVVDKALHMGTQNTLFAYDTGTGSELSQWTPVRKLIATPGFYYALCGEPVTTNVPVADPDRDTLTAVDRAIRDAAPRKDESVKKASTRWVYRHPGLVSMILAGDRLIVGCKGEVTVVDARDGKELWKAPVEGDAVGLTFARGRLLVSTTTGAIYCFSQGNPPPARENQEGLAAVWPPEPGTGSPGLIVERLLRDTNVLRNGYALISGAGAVRLGCEIARRSDLVVTCLVSDPARLTESRERVAATGLYGHRVTVEAVGPGAFPYPDFAANLVVHVGGPGERPVGDGSELLRVLKPCGGVLLLGRAEAPDSWKQAGDLVREWNGMEGEGSWSKLVRGPLAGSGWWTHCYGDAGNTGSSGDRRIQGALDLLWFGEPGPNEAPDRHMRSVSPLVVNGRVFYQGWRLAERRNTLLCFDAYNGMRYWERIVPGAIRFGLPAFSGNLACTEESLFVATGPACHRLDAATGATRAVYETPAAADGTKPDWGYVAVSGGVLFGSTKSRRAGPAPYNESRVIKLYGASPNGSRFSETVFAIDLESGKQLWAYRGNEIRDTTISLEDGRLFFADNRGQRTVPTSFVMTTNRLGEINSTPVQPLVRTIVALDAATGKPAWEREADLTGCGIWEATPDPRQAPGYGELQSLSKDGILVFAASYHKHDKAPAEAVSRTVKALSTRDGRLLWAQPVGNLNRPLVAADTLLAGPHPRLLRTGDVITRVNPKTGKTVPWTLSFGGSCGTPSACDSFVFFRGGWRNLEDGAADNFTGTRAGCFINIIPAGGVVVQPEASSGCTCMHAIQCTIVLSPQG